MFKSFLNYFNESKSHKENKGIDDHLMIISGLLVEPASVDGTIDDSEIDKSRYVLRDRWYKEDEEYGLILTNRAGTFGWNKNIGIGKECFYMHYSMQIDWNGDVLFCIQDIYGKTRTFGNVNDKSLWNIWKSKQMDKYRELLGNGNRTESPCNKCDASGIIHGYNHFLEWTR